MCSPTPSTPTKKPSPSPPSTGLETNAKTMAVVERQLSLAVWTHAILDLAAKWLGGVLIGKLLTTASSSSGSDDTLSSMSPFYRVVLLEPLSFGAVASAATALIVVLVLAVSMEKALAVRLGTLKGRLLRDKVLARATGGTSLSTATGQEISKTLGKQDQHDEGEDARGAISPWDGDWATVASELVRRVSLVEEFSQNEEPLIRYCWLKLALSVVCIFVVLWKAGLVTILLLVVGEGMKYLVEVQRKPFHEQVQDNRSKVHARLLDTIKNAVMIFSTKMSKAESLALQNLESSSDTSRKIDEKWRFARDLTSLPVGLGEVAIPLAAYWELSSGTIDPVRAFELGTAVLIVLLLGDEGHKSLLQLALLFDRELAAKEATAVLADYLGDHSADNASADDKGTKSSLAGVSLHASDDSSSDEERAVPPSSDQLAVSSVFRVCMKETQEIILKDVTLCYPGRQDPALTQVNLSFQKGVIHGLIGESGSGKSTIMKLVAGLISPTHGLISHWDDMEIAYVSQDQNLFARTIRENVSYGAKTTPTNAEIWQALETAQIADFVRALPEGLNQELPEGESMVSGGQLQRLHLAHLFLVWKNANLVLLDECLSALDEVTRNVMIDQLQIFLQDKTAIVITHHSEMLRLCQNVVDMTPRDRPHLLARKA